MTTIERDIDDPDLKSLWIGIGVGMAFPIIFEHPAFDLGLPHWIYLAIALAFLSLSYLSYRSERKKAAQTA